MFKNNDAFLFKAKTIIFVIAVIIGILTVVVSIMAMASGEVLSGITTLISGAVSLGIYIVVAYLLLSVVVDIKHIRNKLYNYDDPELNNFWGGNDNPGGSGGRPVGPDAAPAAYTKADRTYAPPVKPTGEITNDAAGKGEPSGN